MSQASVIDIKSKAVEKSTLPPIVQSIRQLTRKQLVELLDVLFSNTDDALFELADRSQTDAHQEMYFDSMRVIRLNRKVIAEAFLDNFTQGFDRAFRAKPAEKEDSDLLADDEDYTLLDKDELEMTVAVSGIVSKVTSLYSLAVMHLTKRLDALAKTQTISERTNPLGPQALSSSFADSLNELEVGIKIRIILMKLFERFVMEQLGDMYETANKALIDAGVLPDLKQQSRNTTRRSTTASASDQSATQDPAADVAGRAVGNAGLSGTSIPLANGDTIDFSAVQHLLASSPSYHQPVASTGVNLPSLPSQELVNVLSSLQTQADTTSIDITQVPATTDLRSLVLAHTGANGGQKSMQRTDDDTVNFVGMLFDYILNDRNLAIPMKALIGRLQIPIVKLTILDKTFFSKATHPARMLLNELSSAGIGWSSAQELKRDALYDKIEAIVLQVLNGFTDNPEIFDTLLQELREFVSKDNKRSILVEQRVRESEDGKARTNAAKLAVQNLINQKACGLRVPGEAGKFISDVWTKIMVLCCVRHGESSSEWQDMAKTLDNLLWVLQPLSDPQDVAQRRQLIPELTDVIQAEMQGIGSPEEDIREFVTWFSDHCEQLSVDDLAYSEPDERPEVPVAEIEEIILTSTEPVANESDVEPEFLQGLKQLTEGTWVEITESDEMLRCKLATVTQPGNIYVFVNRRGMKVLERNRVQLATLLRENKLKVIDESQVFDRALQSVIGSLRRMQRERQD